MQGIKIVFCVDRKNRLTLCGIVKGCVCTCKEIERRYVNIRITEGLGWNRCSESVEWDSCQKEGEDVDRDQQIMSLGTGYVAAYSREVEKSWRDAVARWKSAEASPWDELTIRRC